MSFDLTILTNKIEGIKEAFTDGSFGDALVGALNTGSGLLQQRVFTENADVEGNSFGQYIGKKKSRKLQDREIFRALFDTDSKTDKKRIKDNANADLTSYQRKRVNKGRQIDHKDLEFSGGLRRSIETQVESETAAVLEFNNSDAAKIAHGQEAQITNIRNGSKGTTRGKGIKIFTLNTDEKEQVVEQGKELINQILKRK